MTQISFITLAVSLSDTVVAYGVFDTRADARLCAEWCGVNDPDVAATRTVALFPPDAETVLTHTTTGGDVFPLPDDVVTGSWITRPRSYRARRVDHRVGHSAD